MKNPWTSEKEICEAAMEWLSENGWDVYPETNDCDIFAAAKSVKNSFVRPGDQMQIEAKMRANCKVLAQSLNPKQRSAGARAACAHWRTVLVPNPSNEFQAVCEALGITAWSCTGFAWGPERRDLQRNVSYGPAFMEGCRAEPETLFRVPEIKVEVAAGVPAPKKVSHWKIAAVKIMLRLLEGGVASEAFKELGLKASTFRRFRWIRPTGRKKGRQFIWEMDPDFESHNPPPHIQWPEIVEAIKQKGNEL